MQSVIVWKGFHKQIKFFDGGNGADLFWVEFCTHLHWLIDSTNLFWAEI